MLKIVNILWLFFFAHHSCVTYASASLQEYILIHDLINRKLVKDHNLDHESHYLKTLINKYPKESLWVAEHARMIRLDETNLDSIPYNFNITPNSIYLAIEKAIQDDTSQIEAIIGEPDTENTNIALYYVEYLISKGQFDKAIHYLNKINPKNDIQSILKIRFLSLAMMDSDREEAFLLVRNSSYFKDSPYLKRHLAYLYNKAGESDKALNIIDTLIENIDHKKNHICRSKILETIGQNLLDQKKVQEGLDYLNESLKENFYNRSAAENLAKYWFERAMISKSPSDIKEASSFIDYLTHLSPDNSNHYQPMKNQLFSLMDIIYEKK